MVHSLVSEFLDGEVCFQDTPAPPSTGYLRGCVSRPEDNSEQTPAKKSCLSEGSFLTSSCIVALFDLLSCALPMSCSRG